MSTYKDMLKWEVRNRYCDTWREISVWDYLTDVMGIDVWKEIEATSGEVRWLSETLLKELEHDSD